MARIAEGAAVRMVQRGSDRAVLIPCPGNKRSAAVLIPLIQRYVLPGTVIMTDGWRAYASLGSLGYSHYVANHSTHFVDPVTGAHINTQEGLWTHAKASQDGNRYVTDALIEYIWRKRVGATAGRYQILNSFNAICVCLRSVFNNYFDIQLYLPLFRYV